MNWISVKDRLPDISGYYLVITNYWRMEVLPFSSRYKAFNAFDTCRDANNSIECIYWMPLPEYPKEEA